MTIILLVLLKMAECSKCKKPLIQNGGRCVYCGHPVQLGDTSGTKESITSMIKTMTTSLKSKKKDWPQFMLRKTIVSIIVTMLLGVLILLTKAWPGCFVSIFMLTLAVILSIYSFLVINLDKRYVDEETKEQTRQNLSNGLNIILLWGAFFFIAGVICMFISWWAVLIVVSIGITGLVAVAGMAQDNELKFIKF